MADHVNADLDQMRSLSARVGDVAAALYDGDPDGTVPAWVFGGSAIAESTFGNTTGASACYAAWVDAKHEVSAASENVWRVLLSDVARLDQAITCFAEMDDAAADEIIASGTLTFVSAHTHSGNTLADDFIRGDQNYRLVDYAAGLGTPAMVGADLNENLGANFGSLSGDDISGLTDEERGSDNYSATAIASFDDHGYADVGPDEPTSNDGEGQRIDHMRARGLVVGDAEVIDGGPSDHHGQSAEVTLPWW